MKETEKKAVKKAGLKNGLTQSAKEYVLKLQRAVLVDLRKRF